MSSPFIQNMLLEFGETILTVINDFYLVRRSWSLYYMFVRWTAPIFNIGVGTRQALLIVTERLISTRPPYTPTIHLPRSNCGASRISRFITQTLLPKCLASEEEKLFVSLSH